MYFGNFLYNIDKNGYFLEKQSHKQKLKKENKTEIFGLVIYYI
jgi:hypothetical protein